MTNDLVSQKFSVEHILSMYASSYYWMRADQVYDDDLITSLGPELRKAHIYLIGFVPIMSFSVSEDPTIWSASVGGLPYAITVPNREVTAELLLRQLQQQTQVTFDVQYIGQAYGNHGSRNAVDRLRAHETFQKIAVRGAPEHHELSLLLLEVEENNKVMTMFNPFASDDSSAEERIKQGMSKLVTTEAETIALYEAALIRYFRPRYNKEFKDSFPSKRLKVLEDCYEKDFLGVSAEICFDTLWVHLKSTHVLPSHSHCAVHNLHEDSERRAFFFADLD